MQRKTLLLCLLILSVLLVGCYEGRGYAYEHLNSQNPGGLRTEDPGRIEVSADNVSIGGTYEHLQNNGCQQNPECCGEFSSAQEYYHNLQQQAINESNATRCESINGAFLVACPNKEPYYYYSREECLDEIR
jgi:hypothetical protein